MGDARESEKDPDAFRTISEVAEDLNLPQHVLRFWETRFPQIKPVKRAGGRRFYRPEDIDLLRGIQQLLYREGYTIKGVQKILKEQGIRHVQDVGVERDVAVMRTAPAERPTGAQDGDILGGLLGLLPRRRGKGNDDPALDPLPRDVELPLPFPDADADRDLAADRGEPVAPLPPRTRERRLAERRYDDGVYEERIYEERDYVAEPRHREPRLTDDPHPRRARVDDIEEFEDEPPAPRPERRAPPADRRRAAVPEDAAQDDRAVANEAPSFAPPRVTHPAPVVQRRPTRGPAARVATAPVDEELSDPLLPFMEPEAPAAPAPLEERIRRLKEREPGPPDEYLPPKLRRRHAEAEAEQPAPVMARHEPPLPRASTTAWPELARASAAVEHDLAVWHEHLSPAEDARAAPEANGPGAWDEAEDISAGDAESGYVPDEENAAWYEDDGATADEADARSEDFAPWPEDDADTWENDLPGATPTHHFEPQVAATPFQVKAPVSARLGMGTLAGASSFASAVRLPASMDQEDIMPAPLAAVRKAPATAEGAAARPAPAVQQRPAPAAPARAAEPVAAEAPVRRVGPLTGPLEDDFPADRPVPFAGPENPPPHAPAAGMGPWSRTAQHAGAGHHVPPAGAFWQGREPFEAPVAQSAPIDPYLPPHLRTEPQRPTGQGGVQPVLSRDDVHRLQATLYELGECRRLLRDVTEPQAESGQA